MPRKPTTRSHGEGSIYRRDYTRRGSGVTVERWIASVDVGIGPNGERLREEGHRADPSGGRRQAACTPARAGCGRRRARKSMTVADLARAWLYHLEDNEDTKEEGTILRLRPRVEKHIVPADRIGERQLDQLTVAQVEGWLRREAESGGKGDKPQTRATCRDYKQMLGEMLECAIARRYITGTRRGRQAAEGPLDHGPRRPVRLQEVEGEGVVHP